MKSCKSCPINITTEAGEIAHNYGCLASYHDALKWYRETGKVWACHTNNKKPCGGFLIVAKENGVEVNVTESTILITESDSLDKIYGRTQ